MCERKYIVYLAGIGMGASPVYTREVEEALLKCDCIIGAARMVESAKRMLKEREKQGNPPLPSKEIYVEYRPDKIADLVKECKTCRTFVVVLSGDTGFYSGAKALEEELKDGEVRLLPGVSCVSYLAAKVQTSWEDAKILSLHGQTPNYIYEISRHSKIFLLLGGKETGEEICEKLRWYHLEDLEVTLGKSLSYPEEEILCKRAGDLRPQDWAGLAAALIRNPHPRLSASPHIRDDAFVRGKAPMTKEEVRAVILSKLQLTKDAVLYDVGAGTGSVSVEAALTGKDIRVYAVEKKKEAIWLLEENKRKFLADGMQIVEGTAPEALEELPAPSHVFIGGSSGNLKEIIKTVQRKNPRVRVVLAAISLETVKGAVEAMEEGLLLDAEVVQIWVSRSQELGKFHLMKGENPIYVISSRGEACP